MTELYLEEEPTECVHKWRITMTTVIGEGVYRRMHRIAKCELCGDTAIWS